MASSEQHISQANRNQDVLCALAAERQPFWDWVAIVAFYKAVHVAEAVFAENEQPPNKHTCTHKDRGALLKKKYSDIWKNYWHLFKTSKIARYLESEEKGVVQTHPIFTDYMPPQVVKNLLLGQYLKNVEKSASGLLSNPSSLKRVAETAPKSTPSA